MIHNDRVPPQQFEPVGSNPQNHYQSIWILKFHQEYSTLEFAGIAFAKDVVQLAIQLSDTDRIFYPAVFLACETRIYALRLSQIGSNG